MTSSTSTVRWTVDEVGVSVELPISSIAPIIREPLREAPSRDCIDAHIAMVTTWLSEFGDFASIDNITALEAQIKTQHAIATTVSSQRSAALTLKALGWQILGTRCNANYPPGEGAMLTLWHKAFPANAENTPCITKKRGYGTNTEHPSYSFFCCGLWIHNTWRCVSRLRLADLESPWLKVMITYGEPSPAEQQLLNKFGYTLIGSAQSSSCPHLWHNAVPMPPAAL